MKSCDSKKHDVAVKMSRKELIGEHKKLLRVLKTGKGRQAEIKKQGKELKQYEK